MNNLEISQIMNAIGWTLLHSLWQITILGVVIWIVLRFISKDNANLRYTIGGISLGLIFIASLFTFTLYINNSSNFSGKEFSADILLNILNKNETGSDSLSWSSLKIEIYFPYLVNLWILGIGILSLHMLWNYIYSIKLRNHLTYPLNEGTQNIAINLVRKIGLNQKVLFKESGFVQVPSLIGYFKPVVLLPISMLCAIPENQIEMIIAHELAHVRRHDYLFQFIQSILEMLFFYHPIVWWLSSVVNTEREHVCDDLAVSVCGESLTLIKALNNMEVIRKKQTDLVLGFSGKKATILNRAQRIIRPKTNANPKLEKVLLSCLFLFLFTGLFLFSNFAISENSFIVKPFYSKMNILDSKSAQLNNKTFNRSEHSLNITECSKKQKKKSKQENDNRNKVDSTKMQDERNSDISKSDLKKPEIPPIPSLPASPKKSEINPVEPAPSPSTDSISSENWVKQKADEMIREQMNAIRSSKMDLDTVDFQLRFNEMQKDLREELENLNIDQNAFKREMKEQQAEIEQQLKEFSDSDLIPDLQMQQKELEGEYANYLNEVENNKQISDEEKEKIKQRIQESIQKINAPEFREKIKKQLEQAKSNLQEQLQKMKSEDWETRFKKQRANLKETLDRLESPEYQQNLKEQIEKVQHQLKEHYERLNSPEYHKELEKSIEHMDKDSIPESTKTSIIHMKKKLNMVQ